MDKFKQFTPLIVLILLLAFGCKKVGTPTIPFVGQFVGSYHVSGYSVNGDWDTSFPPNHIDTIIGILSDGDSVLTYLGGDFYYEALSGYRFSYGPGCCTAGSTITFHKPYDDSIFIAITYSINPASWTNTTLVGKRIQ